MKRVRLAKQEKEIEKALIRVEYLDVGRRDFKKIAGMLRTKGKITKALLDERAKDRERENGR